MRCWGSPATATATCAASTCWPGRPSAWLTASSSTRNCAAPTSPATWRSWRWISRLTGSAGRPESSSAAYRHAGISPGGEALRSFYAAHWALVRAKVALIAAAEHDGESRVPSSCDAAQRLWSLSERLCWRARAPLAVVICGPAASGKSVLAAELARRSEMPVVSSDAVRKRLAHLAAHEPARAEHYSARFTRATYEQLGRDALLALRRSDAVIVDATCRSRE